ncbi:cysteine--tRNA ligase [Allorhizocola rhizosphaerae]|uniref:cysteine--tRNA ligase n=1 Tax=Allorhizocola rhizosphaerae TaxID=1872709 RepID=UPI000E3E48D8|nr:cysteine--tRNA ligase [Allorhizocola rhizosphaerae]
MALRLYDTLTRQVRDFEPREAGRASIYLCGLTVQSGPHIGHLRSGVSYDVLRRWLVHSGYEVTFVRNITDIDDKVLAKALDQGRPFWSIAYENEVLLGASYRALNVLPPTYEPRATATIPEMHELIAMLIERGHAYVAPDGSGDVYFSVQSYPDYGQLSRQKPGEMEPATDGPERAKKDPRDFALWKGVKATEPQDAYWPSPWGRGRPGWHIECSAMTYRFLGPEFDIHGGGTDLVFPHHENEMTQSRAVGHPFARFWVHNGMLDLGAEKMSKSLGNVVDVAAVRERGIRPVELRYYMLAAHYRARIEFSWGALEEAASGYQRIEGFILRATEAAGVTAPTVVCAEFAEAMDDDLNTSAALAALHEVVREGNTALAGGEVDKARGALGSARAMLGLLGLDPFDPAFASGDDRGLRETVDALVVLALQQRTAARERKDWAAADAVRDQLKQAGVVVEDTPHGPRWTIARL